MLVQANIFLRAFFLLVILGWTSMGAAQKRIVPHLTSATGGFTSRVVLSNLSDTTKTYCLLGFYQSGEFAGETTGQLTPFQTVTTPAETLFGMTLSHFEIDQAEDIAVSIVYQRDRPSTGPAHVHETSVESRTWRIFPGNDAVTWDGLAAVNMGDMPADISVTHRDGAGQIIKGPQPIYFSVPPNSKILYLFSQHFESAPDSLFDISSTRPLVLVALRGNIASDYLWENKALPLDNPGAENNRIITHVTSSTGGFRSQVIISNPFETEKTYKLSAFDRMGNLVNTAEGTVAAGHTLFQDTDQFFGSNISHFDISDDTEVLVSISYQKDRDIAGPAQVRDLSRFGMSWRIYPGDQSVTWDGMAMVNQGENPAVVTVCQVDGNGSLIRGPVTITDRLVVRAKELYIFSTDFESEADAFFVVTSTEPLAVMALRGNLDSDFIWENGAVRLPEPKPGPTPPPRIDYAMAFDPIKRVSIMVAGFDENFDLLDDTWLWNGRRWRQAETESTLLPRSHHGGAFDSNTGQMVVFGGFRGQVARRNDFMAFDGSSWMDFAGDPDIPAEDGELVFDSNRNVLVLAVSSGNSLQTWEYNQSGWERKMTAADPGKRIDQGFVYDENRQRVVMFGGLGSGNRFIDETWEYDGNDWSLVNPTDSPPALIGTAMYYDSVNQRVVMFGGMNATRSVTNETWRYDGVTWRKLETPAAPEPRWVAFAAFDPKRGVATLFGGEGEDENGLIMFGGTWEFDGITWSKR